MCYKKVENFLAKNVPAHYILFKIKNVFLICEHLVEAGMLIRNHLDEADADRKKLNFLFKNSGTQDAERIADSEVPLGWGRQRVGKVGAGVATGRAGTDRGQGGRAKRASQGPGQAGSDRRAGQILSRRSW